MTLLRTAARTMLASYFIASGVRAIRHPEPLVPAAEPLADKVVPLVKQYAPDQVADYIPEDAKTLIRVNGAVQIIGGLALASGKGRRVGSTLLAGSLVPSTIAKHPFWSETDPEAKALARQQFLKNISILGGVLLAARDTEGKPSLAWRAQRGGHAIAKSTGKSADKLAKRASSIGDGGSDFADSALAGGAALLGTVVASTRKARKQATKQFARAQKAAAAQVVEARKAAAAADKQAKKDAPKQLRAAKKAAAAQEVIARKAEVQAQKEQAIAAKENEKAAAAQRKAAAAERKAAEKRSGKKVRANIELGSN